MKSFTIIFFALCFSVNISIAQNNAPVKKEVQPSKSDGSTTNGQATPTAKHVQVAKPVSMPLKTMPARFVNPAVVNTDRVAEPEQKPANTEQKPANTEQKPVNTEQKPVNIEQKPANTEKKDTKYTPNNKIEIKKIPAPTPMRKVEKGKQKE